jgi:Myb-like DNA-binding domain
LLHSIPGPAEQEDAALIAAVKKYGGTHSWAQLAKKLGNGTTRSGKRCTAEMRILLLATK